MRSVRLACDSLVALSRATRDGAVWFAKNSDRPADECQPLFQAPRRQHAAGTRVRCTYIDIPQAAETAAVIGSRPFWLWGFEHGLNEYGVAIGNHTVFSKDALAGRGLIGMDLVRLGLERGHTAEEALRVITSLLAQYGQGGSGYVDKEWPYHNSFLLADRSTAFVLETSDRHWAARRVHDVASVSNHLTIGNDWDALSGGAIEHAIDSGWWDADGDARFDFAAAYRDSASVPDVISSGRHRRTCEWLESAHGEIDLVSVRRVLRDHYGHAAPRPGLSPADPRYFSVCMHADPVGTTTASMIARLPADPAEPLVYWASLGSPCLGAFVPLFIDAEIPRVLTVGEAVAGDDSAWWLCKRLLIAVEANWAAHAGPVRTALDAFEARVAAAVQAQELAQRPPAQKSAFMTRTVEQYLDMVRQLTREVSAPHP